MDAKQLTEELKNLKQRRREMELKLLLIDRMIAETSDVSFRASFGVSTKDVEAMLEVAPEEIINLQKLTSTTPIYLINDYSSLVQTISALGEDEKLAALLAERNSL